MMSEKKIYLPGLNGLRAIAAVSVILSHISLGLDKFGLVKRAGLSQANFAVTVFFALSGFLITYLLLSELEVRKTIEIKKFYIRRILRIWPLYFLYIGLVIVLYIGFNNVDNTVWYYVFILPNVPFAFNAAGAALTTMPFLAHYWSLGVEEQFYAFWPWLVKYAKKLQWALLVFLFLFVGFKFFLKLVHAPMEWQALLHYSRFGCLAIGGIGAYYYYHRGDKMTIVYSRGIEIFAWLVFGVVAIGKFHLASIIDHEIVAFFTVIIIYNQIHNPRKLISLENKVFDFLGKISFGLYVYNPLIIYLMSLGFAHFAIENDLVKELLVFVLTIIVIIIVAALSYYYFEKKFLTIKHRYSTVHTASSRAELTE